MALAYSAVSVSGRTGGRNFVFCQSLCGARKREPIQGAVRRAPIIVPFLLIIGLLALFLDLRHKPYFWQLYTTIKIQSPMSWGAWVLMAVTPLSFVWVAIHIREYFPKWDWKYMIFKELEKFFVKNKKYLAWALLFLSTILGIYTGILFSAFNARPLWNTSILGPLFLTSGLSAGAAVIILFSKRKGERINFAKIDIMLIGIELFLIIHMFMGFLASTEVQIEAANLFLGGPYTAPFWIFVVIMGMVLPAVLEFLEIRKFHIPACNPGGIGSVWQSDAPVYFCLCRSA
jgi:protein NrfD